MTTDIDNASAPFGNNAYVVPARRASVLELYQAEECPHSTEVREAMTELGLSFVAHNPRVPSGEERNAHTYAELRTIADADEIPFLVDANRRETIQGSENIVDYLRQYYA